jgi:hypothetical protein
MNTRSMFLVLFVVLAVAWALGSFTFPAAGGLVHLLLIVAVTSLIVHFLRGRASGTLLRGCLGRGIGRTALVASLVALGPCHVRAEGTTAAGTLLGILGLRHVGAEAQRLKGTAAESTVNLSTATQAELEKLPGVGETTAKKILAGRPYKAVADLSKASVSAKTIEKITPLVSVGEVQVPAALASSASSPVPSGALASSTGRASDSVKSGSVKAQRPPTKGMVWANVKSGVFHREGDRWYGKTEQGKFLTEAEARKAGYRPAEEGAAGKKSAIRAPG